MIKQERYQISSVARATGLSVHTIRAWEKRYKVISPERTETGRRLYGREDIRKLTYLKRLVDEGNPIGLVAGLSADQLENRVGATGDPALGPQAPGGRKCSVLVVGEALRGMFHARERDLEDLEPLAHYGSLDSVPHPPVSSPVDLLVVDTPTLFSETIRAVADLLRDCGARRAILVYGFAQRETLRQLLSQPAITAIRGPLRPADLRLAAKAEIESVRSPIGAAEPKTSGDGGLPATAIPPRRYSREQLARLSRIASTVQCECPQHLGKLLSDLTAFEQYSLECENRSLDDARIHAFLHSATARARALLEEALSRVLESEGISI
ncbi:MAG: MerR family transcriptional regulator [Verrucomicrobia bacterium]|nr:MerR family transcriptional regulator [Verrucomicrobiota bacterium]